jgi:hypothetical protein
VVSVTDPYSRVLGFLDRVAEGAIITKVVLVFLYLAEQAFCSWLMHYAKRKVAVSIPDNGISFFNLPNPSSRTMAPGLDSASNGNDYE